MNIKHGILLGAVVAATLAIGQGVSTPSDLSIAQQPLFTRASLPPLNMLVMGKDHKIYYEAYNDASDLTGDGVPDVGYKPSIDYYGYFNSHACYTWNASGYFAPQSHTADKTCGGSAWSGDFLNYLTTSRMDALRRVLYGGWRETDGATGTTILQGAFFPQDAHSWGKEYQSIARDGYDIRQYAPLSLPATGKYHLFAVTTTSDNSAPWFRVMPDSPYRVWNWLSIEGPVAGNSCFNSGNSRENCLGGGTGAFPGHPGSIAAFNTLETNFAIADYRYGSGAVTTVNCNNNDCNPYGEDDNYLTIIGGQIRIRSGQGGTYQFRVNGDDVIDFTLTNQAGNSTFATAGCYNTGGRGFGACSGNESTGDVVLANSTTYGFKFRQEEGSGGDGYTLEWRKRTGTNPTTYSNWAIITVYDNNNGYGGIQGATRSTYDLTPTLPNSRTRTDYQVRVQVCPDSETLREGDDSCRAYPNGHYKPTGILHDYGMTQRMYFGLISGSQPNNLEGGVLRQNIGNFADEINASTGQIRTDVTGIVRTLDRLRMVGGGYGGGSDNYNADSNWNWANGTGKCPSIGDRALDNGECRMWGNPLAEMLYEAMRYFAGAGAGTTRFLPDSGAAEGRTEEGTTMMNLPVAAWKDPYAPAPAGGGQPFCARPFQTIISDINPSYDGDLPGSAWNSTGTDSNPATLTAFNASTEADAIWAQEFGGTRRVFIGEVGDTTDGAPTAKDASSFANIRGLAPEEPTKQGTYYSASVARFARNNDINGATGAQSVVTYSIALASPLPKIEFPVGGSTVTLMPFAKTVSGTFGEGTRKPTNTIVDFYVQRVVNMPGQTVDASVNGGRPLAEFRINYEDVEQGNDHDMDAIVLYEVTANADDTVTVKLTSEYAAGSANQNIGYVISGTTKDGVYLGVRDTDSAQNTSVYELNTPTGVYAGGCVGATGTAPCSNGLGFAAQHTFSPGTSPGTRLQDPLWYAAKYGGYEDANGNGLPDLASEWDADGNGTPDNYFLVTNPLNLRAQLAKAFDRISDQNNRNSGTVGLTGARVGADSFIVIPQFSALRDSHDWIGDVVAKKVTAGTIDDGGGLPGDTVWSAASRMPKDAAVASRKIYTAVGDVNSDERAVAEFKADQIALALGPGATNADIFEAFGYNLADITNLFGSITPNDLVNYLRGDKSKEGDAHNTAPFRVRSSILGDIVNSSPVIASKRANYGWSAAGGLDADVRESYAGYVAGKSTTGKREYVYVGANDGMLHAFDGTNGDEVFAYVPNNVLAMTGLLADPNYGNQPQKRYYVDGQVTLGDAYDGGTWQTVLVAASGAGGRGVFGLQVTDPTTFGANDVLWEVNSQTDADVGHVMAKPVIVPLENGSWAALFGNGYNSGTTQPGNPVLFVVDIFSGEVIRKITANDADTTNPNGLGGIAAIDTNGNGLMDTVYGGDLRGNVWKFDLTASSAASWGVAYGGTPLFVATDDDGGRQPITGGFEASIGPGRGYMLFFGTGRYFVNGDNSDAVGQQVQSLYGIWDGGAALAGSRDTVLVEQEVVSSVDGARVITRNPVNYISNHGWYLDLTVDDNEGTGERFIGTPRIQSGRILFDTYQPGVGSDCEPGGQNWRYGLNLMTGGASLGPMTDTTGNTVGDASTGAVATTSGAPSRDVAVTQPPSPYPPLYCDPTDPDCDPTPPGTKCSEVIIDPNDPSKSLVLQRACGRQSWRQLR